MIDLELALRAPEVKRWTIVSLSRTQSLADHQYRVWLITRELYPAIVSTPHNQFDLSLAMELALTHDLHEVLCGDIPSTVKGTSKLFEPLEDGARIQMGLPLLRAHKGTVPAYVVKIADILEGLLFLFQSGGRDRPAVWNYLRQNLVSMVESARHAHGSLQWVAPIYEIVKRMAPNDPQWSGSIALVDGEKLS